MSVKHKFFILSLFFGVCAQADSLYLCNVGIAHPLSSAGKASEGLDAVSIDFQNASLPVSLSVVPRVGEENLVMIQSDEQAWTNSIRDLHFNFSSVKPGVLGRLHFCYQGPEVELDSSKIDATEGFYGLDFYVRSALLASAKVNVKCDLRKKGRLSQARGHAELTPETFESDLSSSSSTFVFQQQGSQLSLVLNKDSAQVPRFCVIELDFQEAATSQDRPNILRDQSIEVTPQIIFDR